MVGIRIGLALGFLGLWGVLGVPGAVEWAPVPAARTADFAVPVLMYHRVDDLTEREARSPLMRDLTVSPANFEEQVAFLAREGYSFLTVSEVTEAVRKSGELPEKAVCLTFDDGYRDNFEKAFPIMRKYGARGTVFMVTDNIDRTARLTAGQMRAMDGGGVSMESHTVSHPDLVVLGDERLRFELLESRRRIEEVVGSAVTNIAYPAGRFDDRVVAFTDSAGYVGGWNKGGGPVQPGHDPLRLPRIRVHGRTSMGDFERKVRSGLEARKYGLGRGLGWLLARDEGARATSTQDGLSRPLRSG